MVWFHYGVVLECVKAKRLMESRLEKGWTQRGRGQTTLPLFSGGGGNRPTNRQNLKIFFVLMCCEAVAVVPWQNIK